MIPAASNLPKDARVILAIADTHDEYPDVARLPDAHMVLMAGDFTNYGEMKPDEMIRARTFLQELAQRYPFVFYVCGNHDFGMTNTNLVSPPSYLGQVKGIEREFAGSDGLRLYGASLSPAFNAPQVAAAWCRMTADRARDLAEWDGIGYADIILSHCPPEGFLDSAGVIYNNQTGQWKRESLGSPGLLKYLIKNRPLLCVCGHIHEARGKTDISYFSDTKDGSSGIVAVDDAGFYDAHHEFTYQLGQTYLVNCARKPELIRIAGHKITSETIDL